MTHYENIPPEIACLDQWVCARDGDKIPMQATRDKAASCSDPATWSDLGSAMMAVEDGSYDYCGFVFADNGIVGIDIDAGVDDLGLMTPLSADIINHCQSYTEKSRSGRGHHILVRGHLPFKGKNNRAGVEIYQTARYFILTGNVVAYSDIVENQEAIDYVVEKYFPETLHVNDSKSDQTRIYTPVWEPPTNGRVKLRPVYPRIPNGCRNICLTSLAGLLHNQGYTKGQILDEISYCNTSACEPELPDYELIQIANSVTRYKR